MKTVIAMTLVSLISITSFAKTELMFECVDKLNEQVKLSILSGRAGEGGEGVLIRYKGVDQSNKKVTKSYDLKWHTADGAGLGKNVRTLGYSNQSYGEKAHDMSNILHNLELVLTYSKKDSQKPKLVEATLITAATLKADGVKEVQTYAFASNYICADKRTY